MRLGLMQRWDLLMIDRPIETLEIKAAFSVYLALNAA
jgi:hypothetical protein